jgi:lysine 2,3-aminomutase
MDDSTCSPNPSGVAIGDPDPLSLTRLLPALSPPAVVESPLLELAPVAPRPRGVPSLAELRSGAESPRIKAFRKKHFPGTSRAEWNDWRWQASHRFKSFADLDRVLTLSPDERGALQQGGTMLPLGITPYYLALCDAEDASDPLRRTVVPTLGEFERGPGEADDPLGEDGHSPVPGLVHRYPDRVLFLVLDYCTTYCRYCTRSRVVGHGEINAGEARLRRALDYIRATPTIRDVLLSGGDPLSLKDDKLDWLLGELRSIPHVEFVRIGTKMPAVCPQRITPSLIKVLRKHHPLWMSIHFMHPNEVTPEAYRACARLADAGIPLGAQIVLLNGVNDDVQVMRDLVHSLLMMRVRPYYLYQCDPISGSAHLRTSVEKGLEIIEGLRGHTTGYAVPTYVIDAPGGGGKIPLQPNYLVNRDSEGWTLRNYEKNEYRYVDPEVPGHDPRPRGRAALRTLR